MKRFVGFYFLIISLTSCSLDDNDTNFHYIPLKAINAEFPENFTLGSDYPIKVTYIRPDNCTFFEGFDFKQTGITDREITLIGSVIEEHSCTQEVQELTVLFNFEVIYNKTYTFKIWSGVDEDGKNTFLTYQVPVNQLNNP